MTFKFKAHASRRFEKNIRTGTPVDRSEPGFFAELFSTAIGWDKVQSDPCVVLLGEPNIGKSREFAHQHDQLKKQGRLSFLTELKDWLPGKAVIDPGQLEEACNGFDEFYWFVDALDEGYLKSQEVFLQLIQDLGSQKDLGLLRLRLSCRAAEWRPAELQRLSEVLREKVPQFPGVTVVRMLPLDESAIRFLANEKLKTDVKVDRFVDACRLSDVFDLAGFPILLASMLKEFESNGVFARNRTELFERATRSLLDESGEIRVDRQLFAFSADQRQTMADVLASQCLLTQTTSFNIGQAAAMVGSIKIDGPYTPLDILRETLGSGLFTQEADGTYQFVHRSFVDFGAARAFAAALRAKRPIKTLLPAFSLQPGGIPNQMRETASFLAGMHEGFRDWLVEQDPMAACAGDTRNYPAATRKRLVGVLEARFAGLNYQEQFSRFGDLAHDMDVADVRELLCKSKAPAVRFMAIGLIAGSPRPDLLAPVLELALDKSENEDLRVRAISILCWVAPKDYAHQLKSEISFAPDDDRNDELAGAVLRGLYPDFLSADEALQLLHVPRVATVGAAYKRFWNKSFWAQSMSPAERRAALQAFADMFNRFDELAVGVQPSEQRRLLGGLSRHARRLYDAFTEQLRDQGRSPECDVNVIGPWLLAASEWNRRYPGLSTPGLSAAPHAKQLRSDVLRWAATAAPSGREFRPASEVPYFQDAFGVDDLDMLLDFAEEKHAEPRISAPVYRAALSLWWRVSNQEGRRDPASTADRSPALQAELERFAESIKEGEREKQAYFDMMDEDDARDESPHRPLDDHQLAAIKSGDISDILESCIDQKTDFLSKDFLPLLDVLPHEMRGAVRQGALSAFHNFNDPQPLWVRSKNPNSWSIPNGVLAASVGFWEYREQLSFDHDLRLTPAQIELVIWMAVRSDDLFEHLMGIAWSSSHAATTGRLTAMLSEEDQHGHEIVMTIWPRLRRGEMLPPDLRQFAKSFALTHLEAKSSLVRSGVFAFLLQHAEPSELQGIASLLESSGVAVLLRGGNEQEEGQALRSLAMAWLIDAKSVHRFGNVVFDGPNRLRRVIEFIAAIKEINAPDLQWANWYSNVPIERLGELVPYLFANDEKPGAEPDHALSSRNQVFQRITESEADIDQALSLFKLWKDDPRFEGLRSYLTNQHAKLLQRSTNRGWKKMPLEVAGAFLRMDGSVVRSSQDVAYFLEDLIETRLIPAFRKDYALTPLLWGKANASGRQDEKVLQTVVYALLRAYVQAAKVVGAREPEQFDAKKPDLRLDFTDGDHVSVPIEIKWSDHPGVWTAIDSQLVELYMKAPDINYGVYLVAWTGNAKTRPGGKKPKTIDQLLSELQKHAEIVGNNRKKTIAVFAIDATLSSGMAARQAAMSVVRPSRAARTPKSAKSP